MSKLKECKKKIKNSLTKVYDSRVCDLIPYAGEYKIYGGEWGDMATIIYGTSRTAGLLAAAKGQVGPFLFLYGMPLLMIEARHGMKKSLEKHYKNKETAKVEDFSL